MSSHVPQELLDEIFDCLKEDKRALKRCSLVCRAWLYPARRQLFHVASFNSRQVAISFHRKNSRSGSAIARFIRRLTIANCPTEFWNDTFSSLGGFEAVISLTLTHLPWREMLPRIRLGFLNQFAAVNRLHLQRVDTVAFSHLAEIVCSMRCLETLVLGFLVWRKSDVPPGDFFLPVRFRALELQSAEVVEILKWLSGYGERLVLRAVCLQSVEWEHCQTINAFLRVLGSSLETFRFHLAGTRCPIELQHNTQLRTIHLDVWQGHEKDTGIDELLAQVNSVHVSDISLRVCHWGAQEPDLLRWDLVDEILAGPHFSNLRRVEVLPVRRSSSYSLSWFARRLPGCFARGILHLGECDDKRTFL